MQTAGLIRRLAAMLYDALLIIALLLTATALILPFTGGKAVTEGLAYHIYQLYLLSIIVFFYSWCWTRSGQTLGMQAWHIRVQTEEGYLLSWPQALMRLAYAVLSWLPLGLGFIWILFNKDRKAWHDILSQTVVMRVPKR